MYGGHGQLYGLTLRLEEGKVVEGRGSWRVSTKKQFRQENAKHTVEKQFRQENIIHTKYA